MALFRTTLLAILAAGAAASPIVAARETEGYTLAVSGSNAAVNANGGGFYTGKPTDAYCPIDSCQGFPNTTTVGVANTGNAYMAANVPGGQDIYIAPGGALSFTPPHGEGVFPNGSYVTGFYQVHDGYQFLFAFDGASNTGWAECGDDGQIFALVDGNACQNPQPVTIYSTPSSELGAFQYD